MYEITRRKVRDIKPDLICLAIYKTTISKHKINITFDLFCFTPLPWSKACHPTTASKELETHLARLRAMDPSMTLVCMNIKELKAALKWARTELKQPMPFHAAVEKTHMVFEYKRENK